MYSDSTLFPREGRGVFIVSQVVGVNSVMSRLNGIRSSSVKDTDHRETGT